MSLFQRFINKQLSEPYDISVLKADMHSHLIPGIDDGCQSMEESLGLIRKMSDLGFKKIITTPHIMQDMFKNTPEIINSGLDKLRIAVKNAGIPVELEAAAEYLIDDGFEEKLEKGNLLTFGKNYVLVELSFFAEHPNLSAIIFELQIAGYKVVLAHAERYTYYHENFKKYQEFRDRNVYLQLNTISLGGYYSEETKNVAEKLIDNKMIDFLGTDMHNYNYLTGLRLALIQKYIKKAVETNNLLNSTL
ncbi:MAG: hypothetical protein K9J13_07730 [Saprospiraceae bacterium]|nr:hypothetical protein [Saprospiraceae bacterium]